MLLAALSLSALVSAGADKISFGSFSSSGLEGWTTKSFKGETDYRIVEDDRQKVLQAKSQAAASGLVFETEYNPTEFIKTNI